MGVIGAMSAKFAVNAGLLLIAARIDLHSTSAILDPADTISIFDQRDASRIGVNASSGTPQTVPRTRFIGIDHVEIRLRTVRIGVVPIPDGFIFGADLLKQIPLLLDFGRNRLRVPDHRQLKKFESNMFPLAAHFSSDGCLTIEATSDRGEVVKVALVARPLPPSASALTLRFGDVTLQGRRIYQPLPCANSDAAISWDALAQHRLLFDLEHDRIWLS